MGSREAKRAYDREPANAKRAQARRRANPRVPFIDMAQNAVRRLRRYGRDVADAAHWSHFIRIAHLPCIGCGTEPANGVDHGTPLYRGGSAGVENLLPMCWPCNHAKGRAAA